MIWFDFYWGDLFGCSDHFLLRFRLFWFDLFGCKDIFWLRFRLHVRDLFGCFRSFSCFCSDYFDLICSVVKIIFWLRFRLHWCDLFGYDLKVPDTLSNYSSLTLSMVDIWKCLIHFQNMRLPNPNPSPKNLVSIQNSLGWSVWLFRLFLASVRIILIWFVRL